MTAGPFAGAFAGAFTVTAACVGCGACLRTCPEHAIRPADDWRQEPAARGGDGGSAERPPATPTPGAGALAPLVVLATCTGCGECAEVCPVEACVEVPAGPAPVDDRSRPPAPFERMLSGDLRTPRGPRAGADEHGGRRDGR